MPTMTTVSIEAAVDAATDEDCSVVFDVDTTSTTTTTTTKAKSPAVTEKTHAAVSDSDMTVVAVGDDTARSRLTEDKKGITAQPSLPLSSSSPSPPSPSSFSILSRTLKRNPHLSQSKTTIEQLQYQQATSTAASLPPCLTSPSSPSISSSSSTFVEGSLDEVLLTALQNRQDRLFLLKLEREYCNFIEDPR